MRDLTGPEQMAARALAEDSEMDDIPAGGDQFTTMLRNANQRARDWQAEARNWRLRAEAAEARERVLRERLGEAS